MKLIHWLDQLPNPTKADHFRQVQNQQICMQDQGQSGWTNGVMSIPISAYPPSSLGNVRHSQVSHSVVVPHKFHPLRRSVLLLSS